MFPLSSFYDIIIKNLLEPIDTQGYFLPDGCLDFDETKTWYNHEHFGPNCFFYDQEPFFINEFIKFLYFEQSKYPESGSILPMNWRMLFNWPEMGPNSFGTFDHRLDYFHHRLNIIATSELSNEVKNTFNSLNFYEWYYFYHGFAALDWFKKIKYFPGNQQFSKVFISFNNLTSGNRNYRLNLVARLLQKDLAKSGHLSLNYSKEEVKKELFSNNQLSKESKKIIYNELFIKEPRLIIDTDNIHGSLSANDDLTTFESGLFHIVTETIFYEEKLHLTEKIFKPIVSKRPFVLVGAAHNLKYLKKYGFKTFDQWIDESYDDETDPDKRIIKIVNEIEKLCSLSPSELINLQKEMLPVVEHNFNHFFGDFKSIIVDELVDNFERILIKFNAGKDRSFSTYLDYSHLDLNAVKNRLKL